MCLLICLYKKIPNYPLIVAANRDEALDRPGLPPELVDAEHGVVCPIDPRAGGTWLGVNRSGLFAAITDRPTPDFDPARRSRGLICLDALRCSSVDEALPIAFGSCMRWRYNHFNLLLADVARAAVVVYRGYPGLFKLPPALHVLSNGDANDLSIPKVRRAHEVLKDAPTTLEPLVAALRTLLANHAGEDPAERICLHGKEFATLSSTILALHATEPQRSLLLHATGNPCRATFQDFSSLLRK